MSVHRTRAPETGARPTRSLQLFCVAALASAAACSSPLSEEGAAPENASDGVDARPAEVSEGAEHFDGRLDVMIHDDVDGSVDEHHFIELDSRDRFKLVFESEHARGLVAGADGAGTLSSGQRIRVYGTTFENTLLVEHVDAAPEAELPGGEVGQVRDALAGPANQGIGLGDVPVAVVLVGFSGTPNNFDPEEMREAIYGSGRSTNTFYLAGSFGGMRLIGIEDVEGGDVFGPYTLGSSGCDGGGGFDGAGSDARNMAQSDGHDIDAYEKVLHYLPPNAPGCPGGGVAGGRYAFVFGVGINSAWDYAAHEIGHTFGLPHAASYTNCTSGSDVISYGGGCQHDEYGDLSDIMGGRNFQFSSHHLARLGWLPEDNEVTLEASARVRLVPIQVASTGLQSLYVNRSGNENYHFEFRQPLNVDERLEDGLTDGVLVRLVNGGSTTHMLDMTPNNGFNDAALREGRTFTDDGLEVTVVEVTPEAAVIDVVIDGAPVDPTDVVGGDGMPVSGDGGAGNAGAAGAENGGSGGSDMGSAGMPGGEAMGGAGVGGNFGMGGSDPDDEPSLGGMGGTPDPVDDPLAMAGQPGTPPGDGTPATAGAPNTEDPPTTSPTVPGAATQTATPPGAGTTGAATPPPATASGTASATPPHLADDGGGQDGGGCGCRILPSEMNAHRSIGIASLLLLGGLLRRRARR